MEKLLRKLIKSITPHEHNEGQTWTAWTGLQWRRINGQDICLEADKDFEMRQRAENKIIDFLSVAHEYKRDETAQCDLHTALGDDWDGFNELTGNLRMNDDQYSADRNFSFQIKLRAQE